MCLSFWRKAFVKAMISILCGLWFALFYLVIEAITFAILLSISIGIASTFSFLNEVILGSPLSSNAHAIISMMCVTILGEFVILCQQGSKYRVAIKQLKEKHPFIVGKIPSFIGYSFGLFGFVELYIQYKAAHPSKFFQTGIVDQLEFDPDYDPESLNPSSTWIFLLSLSYISYSVVRESDWMTYRLHLTPLQKSRIIGRCTTYTIFMIIQVFLLMFYIIPIYFIALFCQAANFHPETSFVIINSAGFLLGTNAAQLEDIYPFPREPLLAPGYEYEHHLLTRVQVLNLFLFPLICTAYYGPGKLYTSLPAGSKYLLFCLATSITAVQMTKVLLDFRILDRAQHFLRQRRLIANALANAENGNLEAGDEGAENGEIIIELDPHISGENCDMDKKVTLSNTVQVASDENKNSKNNNERQFTDNEINELEIIKVDLIKPTVDIIVSGLILPVQISDENQNKSEQMVNDEVTNLIEKRESEDKGTSGSDETKSLDTK